MASWLDAENDAITKRRAKAEVDGKDPIRWGLALSGGGIRSATFCLGMIKSLAKNGLLTRFDYLSTVSGGGYAGAALGRLFQSVGNATQTQAGLAKDDSLFWWWLRSNGRYLLPAGAKDTIFATSTLLRGMVAIYFDLFLLGVLLSCLIVMPHLVGMSLEVNKQAWVTWSVSAWWAVGAFLPALALTATWAYWSASPGKFLHVRPVSLIFGVIGFLLSVGLLLESWLPTVAGNAKCIPPLPPTFWQLACYFSPDARLALLQLFGATPLAIVAAAIAGRRKDGVPADLALARQRLTRFLMWVLKIALAIIAAALLDMVSWWIAGAVSAAYAGWTAFTIGGSSVVALVILGRALLKWLKDTNFGGGSVNVVRIANVLGLLLGLAFLLFCATFVQYAVFYGGGFSGALPNVMEPEVWAWESFPRWMVLLVPSAIYVVLTGRNLDALNASSLHNFYRARLTRSYVSVGNPEREFRPNALEQASAERIAKLKRVSDVVEHDDVALKAYVPHVHGGPIHLVNVCVNQTVDDRTGQFNRDRKGTNMTVSQVGFDIGNLSSHTALEFPENGAPSLGQWIAISGAAAAPGMGSNTSRGIASLLTLCGVRLGYWLTVAKANSVELSSHWLRKMSPKYANLLGEMFAAFPGSLDPLWYLSDGGHFENTGIYPLIKRQVEVIVAADCGADPKYSFADLNNLVRLARIDFGAKITFMQLGSETRDAITAVAALQRAVLTAEQRQILSLGTFGTLAEIASPESSSFVMMAKIEYAGEEKKVGYLLILKPALIHSLPLDLHSYKSANPTFPQQTTADQFFDEAQWESYFRLGEELGDAIAGPQLGDLQGLAGKFEDHLGTGLAREARRVAAPRREPLRFAGQVVKSSIGVGAVAGLLITLWQLLDQERDKRATETRIRADHVAKAIEKSTDESGNLRVSDHGVLFLNSVLDREQVKLYPEKFPFEKDLVMRWQDQCNTGKSTPSSCKLVKELAEDFKGTTDRPILAYWPGSGQGLKTHDESKEAPRVSVPVVPTPTIAASSEPTTPASATTTETPHTPPTTITTTSAAPTTVPPASGEPPKDSPTLNAAERLKGFVSRGGTVLGSACDTNSRTVNVFTQVYGPAELKALNTLRGELRSADWHEKVAFAAIEDVEQSAKRRSGRKPYRWSKATLIYHEDQDGKCTEALAGLYRELTGITPALRPLPARLAKQAGVIELWVPPGEAGTLATTD